MSHAATNWALEQCGLKAATNRVLLQLAYHHNQDTGGCTLSQEVLAADCDMTRATLISHLRGLEQARLIRRVWPETTFYELSFEHDFKGVVRLGERSA